MCGGRLVVDALCVEDISHAMVTAAAICGDTGGGSQGQRLEQLRIIIVASDIVSFKNRVRDLYDTC